MASIEKFEDIEAWGLSRKLCRDINNLINNTALKTNYGLQNQIDKASGSVMDNIAEGFERGGTKEFIQFLSIAKASCGEVRSQLYRCYDRGFINEEDLENLTEECRTISAKLGAFINYLKKSDLKGHKFK